MVQHGSHGVNSEPFSPPSIPPNNMPPGWFLFSCVPNLALSCNRKKSNSFGVGPAYWHACPSWPLSNIMLLCVTSEFTCTWFWGACPVAICNTCFMWMWVDITLSFTLRVYCIHPNLHGFTNPTFLDYYHTCLSKKRILHACWICLLCLFWGGTEVGLDTWTIFKARKFVEHQINIKCSHAIITVTCIYINLHAAYCGTCLHQDMDWTSLIMNSHVTSLSSAKSHHPSETGPWTSHG